MTIRKLVLPLFITVTCMAASSLASAEVVHVKYRGPVDLSLFHCARPSSSFVHRICYQASTRYAVVLLKNTYYHYCRVPESVIDNWFLAPSVGRFFNRSIKGNYDCRSGGIPRE